MSLQRLPQKRVKYGSFLIVHFGRQVNRGGGAAIPLPHLQPVKPLATLLVKQHNKKLKHNIQVL